MSLAITEMQIQTTLRIHLTLSEWLLSITQVRAHTGMEAVQGKHSSNAPGSQNLYSQFGNPNGSPSDNWESIYLKTKVGLERWLRG